MLAELVGYKHVAWWTDAHYSPLRFDIAGGQCGVSYWKKSVINAIQIGRDKTIEGFLNGRSAEASVAPANGSQETLVDPGAAPDAA